MRRLLVAGAASLPRWVLALPAFGLGLAATMWLDVLPRDTAVYLGGLAAIEAFALFRTWIRSPSQEELPRGRSAPKVVEAEIIEHKQIEGPR